MFESKTFESILSAILARIPPGISKQEGTFTYDVSAAMAVEMAIAYTQLESVLQLGFAQTSSGDYLERRAGEYGLTRKPAVKATGSVTLTGTVGVTVPAGTAFATTSGTRFLTTAAFTFSTSSATASVEAETAGVGGNVASGTITVIPVSIAGVSAVTNAAATSGGVDTETDAQLLARLLDRVRNPATSGNVAHYKQWATEVTGVGDAKVISGWSGPLSVKVVLLDPGKRAPGASIVTAAANYIESQRPIGASVTVVAATEVPVNVSVSVTLTSGTKAAVKTALEISIRDYLAGLAFVDPTVRYTRISGLVLDVPGVQDYTGLTVNGGSANIVIAEGSVPVLGTVTVT